jgi:adenylate cyclase
MQQIQQVQLSRPKLEIELHGALFAENKIPQNAGLRLHPFLPRFVDSKIERRYRDARLDYRLTALRVTILVGILISILLATLDLLTTHAPSMTLFYVRIVGTLSLIAFYAATLLIKPDRWIEVFSFGVMLTQIVLLTFMLGLSSPGSVSYYQPTELWTALGVASFIVCGTSFLDGLILALCTVFAFFISVIFLQPEGPQVLGFHFAWLSTVLALAAVGSFVLDRMQHLAWQQAQELAVADKKIRRLLHNVLPSSIAARKLAGESLISDSFSDASLLFADLVDFTSLSSRLDSSEVVSMLNDLFSRFDRIIARHGLEKIKTVGDCYMAAAGIPRAIPRHLFRVAEAALEMLDEITRLRAPDGTQLMLRIGIHTGPVTAGVIGEAKFIFDVWGDTVNMASRMETYGTAGGIQVSDAVRGALLDDYNFVGPRVIDIKGKGPTQAWFLCGRK